MSTRDSLADVLAAHVLGGDTAQIMDAAGLCLCGQRFYERNGDGPESAHVRLVQRHAAHLAATVRAFLTSDEREFKAAKAIHAAWWHDADADCDDPSGCGPTKDDVHAARAALSAALEVPDVPE